MGATTMVQHKMDISDSKPTSKTSDNKVRIIRIEEVDFFTLFVGGVLGNKIYGVIKLDNGYCNKYKTHADLEKGCVDSTFLLTTNGTNLVLKPMVPLIMVDANQAFLSQLGEDISKYTDMAIMNELNFAANTLTEVVEEAACVGMILTACTEVIDELTGRDPVFLAKRLKTFVPPGIETISDPVIAKTIPSYRYI